MLNKVTLIGRLGVDPEVKTTTSGKTVATLSIATNEVWKDKLGEKQERTEWHRVVVWGPQAITVGRYLSKGSMLYLEGKLQTRPWEDQQGKKQYTTEIIAQSFKMLNSHHNENEPESLFNSNEEIPF